MARLAERPENYIENRDLVSLTPEERAAYIWTHIQLMEPKPMLWDIICFSISMLGAAVVEYPLLLQATKILTKLIYAIHYNTTEPFESGFKREPNMAGALQDERSMGIERSNTRTQT